MAQLFKPSFLEVPQEFSKPGEKAREFSWGLVEESLSSDRRGGQAVEVQPLPSSWVVLGGLLFALPMVGAVVGMLAYGWIAGLIAIPVLFSSLLLAALLKAAQEKRA